MITNKELIYLSQQQTKLDNYIMSSKKLVINDDIKKKKRIAFMVELFEFINEEKSFKYWSNKRNIDKHNLIEEFIDGVHFIVSIGNDINYDFNLFVDKYTTNNIDNCILEAVDKFNAFNKLLSKDSYYELLSSFLNIGFNLKFETKEIIEIYEEKNKKNFERQDNGY
ncbi:dUTP diphosphatase [Spiroplasma sp. TIUS-1]|uniref:dUTP diphosphatase n=1 Tax=Spiroplasma sp. TIUS-1 TaxID=216963 RepID=UPI00139871DC|nr:dUTP diphosphatase [Spiroplasma sp. TIUS-1]QHX35802.1 dUTP diphosphatase [Spiroplasma sp. TIUS-1]